MTTTTSTKVTYSGIPIGEWVVRPMYYAGGTLANVSVYFISESADEVQSQAARFPKSARCASTFIHTRRDDENVRLPMASIRLDFTVNATTGSVNEASVKRAATIARVLGIDIPTP